MYIIVEDLQANTALRYIMQVGEAFNIKKINCKRPFIKLTISYTVLHSLQCPVHSSQSYAKNNAISFFEKVNV